LSTETESAHRYTLICRSCDRTLTVRHEWIGRDVQCPHCSTVLRVPPPTADNQPVRAAKPTVTAQLEFNFGCPRCDTLLEAHTGLCGQRGACPTCGVRLVVPELSRATGMPGRAQLLDDSAHDRVPVHAYAASGAQAPRIVRRGDGSNAIECPRCNAYCGIEVDACPSCGTPFTIDAAPTARSWESSPSGTAALVVGILALPTCPLIFPSVIAMVFGVFSLNIGKPKPGSGVGLVGLILGLIAFAAGLVLWLI
jgi:hypothetical protein